MLKLLLLRHAIKDSNSVFGMVGFIVDAKGAVPKLHLCNILGNCCNMIHTFSFCHKLLSFQHELIDSLALLCIVFMGLSSLRDRFIGNKQVHREVCEQNWTVS
jgi:hypothetical protein